MFRVREALAFSDIRLKVTNGGNALSISYMSYNSTKNIKIIYLFTQISFFTIIIYSL